MGDGGTQKWCPNCRVWREVQRVETSSLGEGSGQYRSMTAYEDIQFFRRGQRCLSCNDTWISAEVPLGLIHELVRLRLDRSRIKEDAEAFSQESKVAAKSLAKLSKFLGDLRDER